MLAQADNVKESAPITPRLAPIILLPIPKVATIPMMKHHHVCRIIDVRTSIVGAQLLEVNRIR